MNLYDKLCMAIQAVLDDENDTPPVPWWECEQCKTRIQANVTGETCPSCGTDGAMKLVK